LVDLCISASVVGELPSDLEIVKNLEADLAWDEHCQVVTWAITLTRTCVAELLSSNQKALKKI